MAEPAAAGAAPPAAAAAAVLVASEKPPEGTPTIEGYDFNGGVDYKALLESLAVTGFQATAYGNAVARVREMLRWRLSDEPVVPGDSTDGMSAEERANTRCKVFLGYTSNLISSGVRESIRFCVQHSMVDVVVTTAGGVEEDIIKCLAPTYVGDFHLKGLELRKKGLNRIGNMLVPNENYCAFEDFIMPILDKMLEEQTRDGVVWTPSSVIWRLGQEINDESSVCYWAWKNKVRVYCPALTDGSIGDMLYFHSYKNPGLVIDLVADIRKMNDEAVHCPPPRKTGAIILGGGVAKHHIMNCNLMRNGADFAVFINTAQEFDGSDSGARPDEAVSWGKIRAEASPVKVYADATLVFPLLVAQTFAQEVQRSAREGGEDAG